MVAHRGTIVTFGALTMVAAIVLAAFVFPGYLVTTFHCTPNVQLPSSEGPRAYCSEEILVGPPADYAYCVHGSINGTPVEASFANAGFLLHTFEGCGPIPGPANFNLDITVLESTGSVWHGCLPSGCGIGLPIPGSLLNWTTPDGRAGIQWNYQGMGVLQPVLLLVAR